MMLTRPRLNLIALIGMLLTACVATGLLVHDIYTSASDGQAILSAEP